MNNGYTTNYKLNLKVSNRLLRQKIKYLEGKLKLLEDALHTKRNVKFTYTKLRTRKRGLSP